jgi:hypothetical protein
MKASSLMPAIVLSIALAGCNWVVLNPEGKRVRVASSSSNVVGCEPKGEITASVRDRIAFMDREPAKVADEVEALARNEAANLGADTILPQGEVVDGGRTYSSFRCK